MTATEWIAAIEASIERHGSSFSAEPKQWQEVVALLQHLGEQVAFWKGAAQMHTEERYEHVRQIIELEVRVDSLVKNIREATSLLLADDTNLAIHDSVYDALVLLREVVP